MRGWKKIFQANSNQKTGILVSDTTDIRSTKVITDKGYYILTRVNTAKRHDDYKHCEPNDRPSNYETNTDITEDKNRQFYNSSWRFQ